jgi:hypothetical protein
MIYTIIHTSTMAAKYQKTMDGNVVRKVSSLRFLADRRDGDTELKDVSNASEDISQETLRISRRKLPVVSRKVKEGLAEEQVSFIILTRDNNKPDTYGQHSSTTAPLPWPAVAEAYNKAFRIGEKPIGSAAMEKRARQHREEWMAARPDYPRNIVYAKKVKEPKEKVQRGAKEQLVPLVVDTGHKAHIYNRNVADQSTDDGETMTDHGNAHTAERRTRVGGFIPPDIVRNQDMYGHDERVFEVAAPAENECTAIEVYDVHANQLSTVYVRTQDIMKSSAVVAGERMIATDLSVTLRAFSSECVQRYVDCISPVQLHTLPDFAMPRKRERDCTLGDAGERIVWSFAALVSLYNVATALQDSHVRHLVINRWLEMQIQHSELELDANALHSLFEATEPGDPARNFWAIALYSAGLAKEIVGSSAIHRDLVVMLERMIVGA